MIEKDILLEGQEYLYRELLQLKEQNKTLMEQLEQNQTNMYRTLKEEPSYIPPIPPPIQYQNHNLGQEYTLNRGTRTSQILKSFNISFGVRQK